MTEEIKRFILLLKKLPKKRQKEFLYLLEGAKIIAKEEAKR